MRTQLSTLRQLPNQTIAFSRTPRARKLVWWIFGVVIAIGIVGALVAPPLVRHQLEQELTKVLHRKVTIETLRINPYTLTVTMRGLRVNERDGEAAALSVDEIYADASLASLYRLAPVLAAIRIAKLQVQVVRLEANRYNWSDLIDEFLNKPRDPNEPPPRFSVANIEMTDSGIDFDDRPEGLKHALSAIQLALPFLSSLPLHQEINVEPKFSANFDGAPLELVAKARPFKDSRDSALSLDLHGLDLTRFLKYVPGTLPVKVTSALLDTAVAITFAQPRGGAPSVALSGKVALRDLDVQEPSGPPLLKLPQLALELRAIEPLVRRFEITKVTIESPELWVHRRRNDDFLLLRLLTPPASPTKPETAETPGASPLSFKIDEVALTAGKLDILDERASRPIRRKYDDVRLTLQGLSSVPEANARYDLAMHSTSEHTITAAGTLGLQPLRADGTLKLERVQLPQLWPYAEPFIELDATDGQVDISTAFAYSAADDLPNIVLKDLEVALRSLVLRQRWDKQEVLRIPALAVRGAAFDLRGQTVTVGEVASNGGHLAVRRYGDGILNLQKLMPADTDVSAAQAPAADPATGKPWVATLQKLSLDRYGVTAEDESAGPAATARIENLNLTASNLSTTKGQRSNIALKLNFNKTGTLAASGPVTIAPLSGRLNLDVRDFGIVPMQPYFERHINAIVSSGNITAKGAAVFDLPEGGTPRGSFKGDVTLADFVSIPKAGNEDVLRWKTFYLGGVDIAIEPLKVAVAEVSLTDFYTRLIVTPEGRFNLQGMIVGNDAAAEAESTQPAAATTAPKPAPVPAPPAVAATAPAPDIQIGKITLAGGNVNFSDFFIKPNYSANLTGVGGTISAITRETAGDVDLRARIDNTAPVEIVGKINPLAKDLFLDIKADARDIELAPLTAYSQKYVGYGIEKGKLSMSVAYKLDGRKLTAQNKVILNQLTFGEKVDSPTATKLPVLFAVSLLKDRNGVIDIDLPISGSIDDPQFSVGGIIVRVIVNLIVKIVTSPFALIGSLFGGGGEELAYIEFAPGSAALTSAAGTKLGNISKALNDRPALKLEIAGRVDPAADREGLMKSALERKVKAQKLKDTVKGGAAAGSIDQIAVEPGEYSKYLAKAYSEEKFPKPRNAIGLAKDLPAPEMEQLILQHAEVSDEDLRLLANQRAQKVKDNLVETGKIPAERVFLLAPKLSAEGIKDKGEATRVDFSLK